MIYQLVRKLSDHLPIRKNSLSSTPLRFLHRERAALDRNRMLILFYLTRSPGSDQGEWNNQITQDTITSEEGTLERRFLWHGYPWANGLFRSEGETQRFSQYILCKRRGARHGGVRNIRTHIRLGLSRFFALDFRITF